MNEKLPFSYATRRKRRKITQLFKEQNGLCVYCKKPMWLPWDLENIFEWTEGKIPHTKHKHFKSRATLEHKKPRANGGSKINLKNLACSCSECNGRKGNLSHYTFVIVHRSDILYKLTILYHRCNSALKKAMHTKKRQKVFS